jgi:hypothetical protein
MGRGWLRGAEVRLLALRVGRVVWMALTAPVFSAGALASGLLWVVAPGLATRLLWRWSSTPGTRLHAARERALLRAARQARRLGV